MEAVNPFVHFSTVENKHDSSIVNHYELPWTDLMSLLTQGHKVVQNKDTTMFGPWKFKTKADDYEPRYTSDGELYLIDGEDVVGRNAFNVKSASMICLDYDGGMSLEYAKNKFGQYTHVGYTSYGHKSPEKNFKDCFRIVLPLAQEVTPDEIKEYRKSIYEWAEGVDPSSLSIARFFFIPACPQERVRFAQSWSNDGTDLFDVKEFDKEPAYVESPLNAIFKSEGIKDDDRKWLIEKLSSIHVGYEPDWYKMAIAFYCNGFSYNDFVHVTVSGFMKQKSERDCEKKWKQVERNVLRSGLTVSVGYLFNLLKEHGIRQTKTTVMNEWKQLTVAEKKNG